MLFNSTEFLLFLPIVFGLYWLLRRHLLWQNLFVVGASYLFYGWWDWRFLLLIAFTTGCSYASGLLQREKPRRWVMWGNIALNLAILGMFKYYDFFVLSFADTFLGDDTHGMLLNVVLPVGISFYTFQALSYTIDVYRRTVEPTRNAVAFFAYVSFFPQLVAGPIERATSLLPQFLQPRQFSYPLAADGLRQMLWGFFKKLVVADSCAHYVDLIYAHPDWFNGASLLLAAVLFSFQIYGDFSGYSDIAIGCAKLFGIRLRRNFSIPYFSRDIAEFWRRWHISLTTWFRDYVYIPLGGSRVSRPRVAMNTFVIFLLSGLWHGANWTYLAWGFYHAFLFLPLILLGRNRRYTDTVAQGRRLPSLREAGQILLTFLLVTVGFVIFRSPDIGFAVEYLRLTALNLFHGAPALTSTLDAWVVGLSILLVLIVEWVNRTSDHPLSRMPRCRWVRWACYAILCCATGFFMVTREMPFIYFQF